MMRRLLTGLLLLFATAGYSYARLHTGLILSYDSHNKLRYGAELQYDHTPSASSFYLGASAFTSGSAIAQVRYTRILPALGLDLSVKGGYFREKGEFFYGFNGYDTDASAVYNDDYYRLNRNTANVSVDLGGPIWRDLRWTVGYEFRYLQTGRFTGKDGDIPTLYDMLVADGTILAEDAAGGRISMLRAGLSLDLRNDEDYTTSGVRADAEFRYAPAFLGTSHEFLGYRGLFSHWLPLVSDRLVLAYRLQAEGFVNDPAFYALPYDDILSSGRVRGILRNRIQGRSVAFFNSELRYEALRLPLGSDHFRLVACGIFDGGRVLVPFAAQSFTNEKMHLSAGAGIHVHLPGSTVLTLEYVKPFRTEDSRRNSGRGIFYVHTGVFF